MTPRLAVIMRGPDGRAVRRLAAHDLRRRRQPFIAVVEPDRRTLVQRPRRGRRQHRRRCRTGGTTGDSATLTFDGKRAVARIVPRRGRPRPGVEGGQHQNARRTRSLVLVLAAARRAQLRAAQRRRQRADQGSASRPPRPAAPRCELNSGRAGCSLGPGLPVAPVRPLQPKVIDRWPRRRRAVDGTIRNTQRRSRSRAAT